MNFKKAIFTILLVTLAVGAAMAQTSGTSTTPIVATKAESLTITATAPLATYNLGALAAQTLNISSYWNVNPARANVTVCVYMDATTGTMKGTGGNASVIDQTMVANQSRRGRMGQHRRGYRLRSRGRRDAGQHLRAQHHRDAQCSEHQPQG